MLLYSANLHQLLKDNFSDLFNYKKSDRTTVLTIILFQIFFLNDSWAAAEDMQGAFIESQFRVHAKHKTVFYAF